MKDIRILLVGMICSMVYCFFLSCQDQSVEEEVEAGTETETEEESGSADTTVATNVLRMLWASINGTANATSSAYYEYNNVILVSWRLLDTDDENVGFDLYRTGGSGDEVKLNESPITDCTCFQDTLADLTVDNTYRLCYTGETETLDTYTITAEQASEVLPYISIPLQSTTSVNASYEYIANDASVGDLDGDGVYEIILKRLVDTDSSSSEDEEDDSEGGVDMNVNHYMLLEAYRLDGTFLWRMCMGPNVLTGNGGSFAVYDFNGDGKCEIGLRTAEGTIFGDGTEIGDTDGDGVTDYRVKGENYIHGGPEFLSVIDGMTGAELARTDYIELGTSEDWGDDYYKRSSSYRIGVAKCTDNHTNIIIGRGCYAKIVVEAWTYANDELTREWRFDTTDGVHGSYAAQGYHSLRTGDVDGDGLDEIVYGSMTIDHDGTGLNNCGLGHGDAIHLGKFAPSRDGLQIWACYETGTVGAALRDATTGNVIWQYDSPDDVGRCLVADIDPDSPGCEMWWYQGNAHSPAGVDLGYAPGYCNMAIWWSGSLNRQLYDRSTINAPCADATRIFTVYRYDVTTINGTKANPCFYGDIVGDWREELIQVTTDNTELRLFTTWFPTDYRFPWLMTDHVYEMSALNENIGYNQPTHTGFYLGSDLVSEE